MLGGQYSCTRTVMNVHTHAHTHIHTHIHTYTPVHTHIHTPAHTCTHTHTHTHTHTRKGRLVPDRLTLALRTGKKVKLVDNLERYLIPPAELGHGIQRTVAARDHSGLVCKRPKRCTPPPPPPPPPPKLWRKY